MRTLYIVHIFFRDHLLVTSDDHLHPPSLPNHCIGVNCPAIVRKTPHFRLLPAFPHFCQNVLHFWLYFEITKIAIIFAVRRHVRKSSAKTAMIAPPSYLIVIFIQKYVKKIAENRNNNDQCRRHFVRESSAKT